MPNATDQQMQAYCDQRIRPRAEQLRSLYDDMTDDIQVIGDEYARATSSSAWSDARTDGPPHLLQSGNSANPDDLLNYNAFISAFTTIINGTATGNDAANAATLRSTWSVLQRACVRPVQV